MSNPIIERLIDLKPFNTIGIKIILQKALDELNSIITTKIKKKIEIFMHGPIDSKIVIEKIEKDKQWQSIRNKKNTTRKALKEFETGKTEDIECKLRFLNLKNRYFK